MNGDEGEAEGVNTPEVNNSKKKKKPDNNKNVSYSSLDDNWKTQYQEIKEMPNKMSK